MHTLQVEKREKLKKHSKSLLGEGKIPAVVYGKKEESTPIQLSAIEFEKVWHEAGESTVITLSGLGEDKEVLIHEVNVDPLLSHPRHVDFYAIEKGKKVEVDVPIEFVGISPAEKELGGTVVKVLHELQIEAFPKDLPQHIEVDLVALKDFESRILAGEIKLPTGVSLISEPEEVVALAEEAKEEEEDEVEAPDIDSIKVEEKGKKDDGEEGDVKEEKND